jgi:hypothetical protein
MAIPLNYGLGVLWAVAVLSASSSHAQVFTYRHGAENFQAVVSDDRLVVKERYQGISSVYGDLSCPLGGPVKAHRVADSKLCITFSKESCRYTRYQNGVAVHTDELMNARIPKMCIVLSNDREVRHFVSLVNAGVRQPQEPIVAMGATADKTHSTVAGPDPSQGPATVVVTQQAPAALEKLDAAEIETRTVPQARSQESKAAPAPQKDQQAPGGKWATGSFTVGLSGNPRMRERTYAAGSIVNDSGAARRPGGYLRLRNTSEKHPLYYGLHKQARYKLDPGEQVTIPLAATVSQRRNRVSQQVVIRWLQEVETLRAGAAVKTAARAGRPQDKSAVKTSPPPRPPTMTGRTLTVQSGDALQAHRVAARVE